MADISRQLLLESDQYAETMLWNNDYCDMDDSVSVSSGSSGYDSTSGSSSDFYSCTSDESVVSCQQPIRNTVEPEVMQFKSVQPVCDSLQLILSMPELCDVTFVVGPEQVPVHGVRAILGTRSRKFYELIIKHRNMKINENKNTKKSSSKKPSGISCSVSDRLVIPVKRYDVEVFRNLIQFVHCGSVKVTDETAPGLYCGSCQFELPDLTRACLDFIKGRVQSGNYETLLTSTRSYSQHKASKTLFDMIYAVLDKRYKAFGEVSV